ncbi:MAG: heavy metal-binding domain-containing protein [Verrucomicrobiales bacterium]|nr:heavy metal-binding domain-containing protein [Verrucomicrobiales bacterium]
MESLFGLFVVVVLLVVGFSFGRLAESRHYASIKQREADTLNVPAVTCRRWELERPIAEASLAVGSVVVSVDYFKRFLTGLRKVFGGELHSYASLIDRGRREALLRMKESCPDAHLFLNCRLETSSISKGQGDSVACVEVLAYGTAIRFADGDAVRSQATD